jgi:hypothetical protein
LATNSRTGTAVPIAFETSVIARTRARGVSSASEAAMFRLPSLMRGLERLLGAQEKKGGEEPR